MSFVMQLFVFNSLFNVQEVKAALVAAEHVFLLQTQTNKDTLRVCFGTSPSGADQLRREHQPGGG